MHEPLLKHVKKQIFIEEITSKFESKDVSWKEHERLKYRSSPKNNLSTLKNLTEHELYDILAYR